MCGVYMEFCKVEAMMGIQLDYTDKIHYYFENVRLILFDEICKQCSFRSSTLAVRFVPSRT